MLTVQSLSKVVDAVLYDSCPWSRRGGRRRDRRLRTHWRHEQLMLGPFGEGCSSLSSARGHPLSVSAVPSGPGIDIWRSCRFIGAMMRSLCLLPGGLGRFCTLHHWCWSLQASACWLGEVWSWAYFSASEECLWSFLGSAFAVIPISS